jgi:hypothetical protein
VTTTQPLVRKAQADLLLDRAALQLRELLREAARELRPFPAFPGAFFTNAIECEPDGAASPERGCVVVCDDGELYELQIGVDQEALADGLSDPVALRDERRQKLDDLHPRDYIVYAYNGLLAITEALLERQEASR